MCMLQSNLYMNARIVPEFMQGTTSLSNTNIEIKTIKVRYNGKRSNQKVRQLLAVV